MHLHEEKLASLYIGSAAAATGVSKVAESASDVVYTLMGFTLFEWVQILSAILVLLQIGLLLIKYWRMFMRWYRNEPTHRRDDDSRTP